MDDRRCQQFFLEPSQVPQRQYEAVRAFFVDRKPLPAIARRFGYAPGTLRNLVCRFRAQCQAGLLPPFSPLRDAGDLREPSEAPRHVLTCRRSPTAASRCACERPSNCIWKYFVKNLLAIPTALVDYQSILNQ